MNKLARVLKKHQSKFKPTAWQNYTPSELAQWVALFSKRSTHRSDKRKALEDIKNAENYLTFLRAQVKSMP